LHGRSVPALLFFIIYYYIQRYPILKEKQRTVPVTPRALSVGGLAHLEHLDELYGEKQEEHGK
jgi:hypothetical protein